MANPYIDHLESLRRAKRIDQESQQEALLMANRDRQSLIDQANTMFQDLVVPELRLVRDALLTTGRAGEVEYIPGSIGFKAQPEVIEVLPSARVKLPVIKVGTSGPFVRVGALDNLEEIRIDVYTVDTMLDRFKKRVPAGTHRRLSFDQARAGMMREDLLRFVEVFV